MINMIKHDKTMQSNNYNLYPYIYNIYIYISIYIPNVPPWYNPLIPHWQLLSAKFEISGWSSLQQPPRPRVSGMKLVFLKGYGMLWINIHTTHHKTLILEVKLGWDEDGWRVFDHFNLEFQDLWHIFTPFQASPSSISRLPLQGRAPIVR